MRGKDNTTGIAVVEVYNIRSLLRNHRRKTFTSLCLSSVALLALAFSHSPPSNPGKPSGLVREHDDWMNSSPADKQAIIDSTIPPSNDLEPATVRTLPASPSGTAYTAVLRGVNNSTGIGVIEVYDLDRSVDSKLANISTRGLV